MLRIVWEWQGWSGIYIDNSIAYWGIWSKHSQTFTFLSTARIAQPAMADCIPIYGIGTSKSQPLSWWFASANFCRFQRRRLQWLRCEVKNSNASTAVSENTHNHSAVCLHTPEDITVHCGNGRFHGFVAIADQLGLAKTLVLLGNSGRAADGSGWSAERAGFHLPSHSE